MPFARAISSNASPRGRGTSVLRADVHKKLTFAVASVASGKVPASVRVRLKEGDEHDDGIAGGDSPRVPARFAVDDARAFLHRALRFW